MPAPYVVRRAARDDAESLTDLQLDCWDDAYTGVVPQSVIDGRRLQRTERIVNWATYVGRCSVFVAEDETGLVGFASSGPSRDPDFDGPPLELFSLYCRARVWGHSIGHALLVAAIGDQAAYLWVLKGNRRAIGFYERQGFVLDGVEQAEVEPDWADGVDARMVRSGLSRAALSPL